MQNKRLIIWLCLIVLISMLVYYKYKHNSEVIADTIAVTTALQSTETALQQNTELTSLAQDKEAKKSNLQIDNLTAKQQTILSEIETRVFSDDAYIELISLSLMVGLCGDEIDIPTLLIELSNNYQQQQDLAESLIKNCEGYRKQYSNVLSMTEKNLKNVFQPTSQLGRLLKAQSAQGITQIERQENAELTLLYSLKEKNSSLILISAFMQRFGGGNHQPLKTVLKSNDIEYIAQMSQLALSLLSCEHQNGQSCRSTSMIMVMACSQDPDSCGLDFPTWYENNTLPGMKKDVEKLMAYYRQLNS